MKRAAVLFSALCIFALAGCGARESGAQGGGNFSARVNLNEGVTLSSCEAKLCDGDGNELGSVTLNAGKNSIPKEKAPCYVVLSVPEEYDCPAVYADGTSAVTIEVSLAEEGYGGGYEHTFTAFLKGFGADTRYRLQMCVDDQCRMENFKDGVAKIFLADGEYELEVISSAGTEPIVDRPNYSFSASGNRFCVIDLTKI